MDKKKLIILLVAFSVLVVIGIVIAILISKQKGEATTVSTTKSSGASGLAKAFGASGLADAIPGLLAMLSDSRLKRDIKFIGKKNGVNIYSFRYLWSDELHTGVMAQEIEQSHPDCVTEINGYKAVNYYKLFA